MSKHGENLPSLSCKRAISPVRGLIEGEKKRAKRKMRKTPKKKKRETRIGRKKILLGGD